MEELQQELDKDGENVEVGVMETIAAEIIPHRQAQDRATPFVKMAGRTSSGDVYAGLRMSFTETAARKVDHTINLNSFNK